MELGDVAPLLSHQYFAFALHRGVAQYICTAIALHPWQPALLVRAHTWIFFSAKEQHNAVGLVSSSERGSVLTPPVCALTLPCLLCLLAFGNLLWGQRARLLSLESWTHPQWRRVSPVPGTWCRNQTVRFLLLPMPCEFPLAIKVFALWAFQLCYSGN